MPKNINLARYLLEIAEKKAGTEREKDEIEYYKYECRYWGTSSWGLTPSRLARRTSSTCLPTCSPNWLKKNSTRSRAYPCFNKVLGSQTAIQRQWSIRDGGKEENGQTSGSVLHPLPHIKSIWRTFLLSSYPQEPGVYDNRRAWSQRVLCLWSSDGRSHVLLSDGTYVILITPSHRQENNIKLYLKYLKMAAEAGVMEAQHNLGC